MNKINTEKLIHSEEDLPQKSDKWKALRAKRIASSEISILRGTFPKIWSTPFELFLQKMGKEVDFSNKYTQLGNEHEDVARQFVVNYLKNCSNESQDSVFCKNVYDRTGGFTTIDPNFVQYTAQYKENPEILTSFDGIDEINKIVLEIKCPSQDTFRKILKNRKPTIPKMYRDQIQTQLMIANSHWGIKEGIFAVFFKEGLYLENKKTNVTNLIKLILIKTELDEEYCKEMVGLCEKYLKLIQERRWKNNWND